MRVLVYGIAADKLGGIETFLFNMNKFMSDDTIFDYVVEGVSTIHEHTIKDKGGIVYFISPKRNAFKNIRDWIKLLKQYKSNSKILYLNMYSLAWLFPVLLGKLYGYKVIVHAHNSDLRDCGFFQKFLHKINRFVLNFIKFERYTNSELSSRFFFGNKTSELIFNAIETKRFAFDKKVRNSIRNELNISGKNVYGFSGRIANSKNPIFLMKIFNEIKKIDDNAAFLVCGSGNLMDSTKAVAAELDVNVLFLGNVKNIQDYYQAMDCFILPSFSEGLGIVLIEAQCSGLPTLASKNVVPNIAKISELLTFIELDQNEYEWAKCAVASIGKVNDRTESFLSIEKTRFNICGESKRLETLLRNLL